MSWADGSPLSVSGNAVAAVPLVASNLVGWGRVCAAGDRSKAAPAYHCDEVLARIASALALLVALQSRWPWPLPLRDGAGRGGVACIACDDGACAGVRAAGAGECLEGTAPSCALLVRFFLPLPCLGPPCGSPSRIGVALFGYIYLSVVCTVGCTSVVLSSGLPPSKLPGACVASQLQEYGAAGSVPTVVCANRLFLEDGKPSQLSTWLESSLWWARVKTGNTNRPIMYRHDFPK